MSRIKIDEIVASAPVNTDQVLVRRGAAEPYEMALVGALPVVTPDQFMRNEEPGVTNMSPAFAAAFAYLNSIGGGKLTGRGTYRMENCVEMFSNTWWDTSGMTIVVTGALDRAPAGTFGSVTTSGAHDLFYIRLRNNVHIYGSGYFDQGGQTGFLTAARLFDFIGCTDYSVTGLRARIPGAFTASRESSFYKITRNSIEIASTSGVARHDGVIDQWHEVHDFEVAENRIEGNGLSEWPILITGEGGPGTQNVYNFLIANNVTRGSKKVGIHAMGRYGKCSEFVISGNIVESVSVGEGILATDCVNFVITGNVTKNTQTQGISLKSESVGTYGDNGAQNFVVSGNTVVNANIGASGTASGGSAISILDNSGKGVLGPNSVNGTTHTQPYFVGPTLGEITIVSGHSDPGTLGSGFLASPNTSGLVIEAAQADLYANGLTMRRTATQLQVRGATTETQQAIIGEGRTGDGQSSLTFRSDGAGQASLAINSFAGANGLREIRTRGTGALQLVAQDVAAILLATNATNRVRVEAAGQVAIGPAVASANAAAALDVQSTTGGLLFPRMDTTQRNAIGTPPDGLTIYNTTVNKLQTRAAGAWVDLH